MAKITNALIATITATSDVDSTVAINRNTGNPAIDANFAQLSQWMAMDTNPYVVQIPPINNVLYQVYVKNVSGSGNISVSWVPAGGGVEVVIVLKPGGQILFWDTIGTPGGITALNLLASAAGCIAEYFIGG